MNIGIYLFGFTPRGMGGVETYIRNLLNYLQKIDRKNSYTLICSEKSANYFDITQPCFHQKAIHNKRGSLSRFVRSIARKVLRIDLMNHKINRMGVHIIHYPFNVICHPDLKIPSILTFHDMLHEFYPEFFSRSELDFRRKYYKISAQIAKRIIVLSNHTKDTLITHYSIPPDKIDIVYQGYGEEYRIINDQTNLKRVKKTYDISKPFLYYPAAIWPHKNHKRLFQALKILKERKGFEGILILSGILKHNYRDIKKEIDGLGLNEVVKDLGYLPHTELPYLYNLARIMVFPSLFEGFGIPLIESMACGCPVICSNKEPICEVVGNAAELFNPYDPEDIAEKIWLVWTNKEKSIQLKRLGLERAKVFNWYSTVEKTLEVYMKAGNTNSI